MLSILAKVVGHRILKRELNEQTRLGYKLNLVDPSGAWINGLMLADMTKTWEEAKLKCSGLNFFTLGAVENGLSNRYKPDHTYYQGWLGGYLVKHDESDWTLPQCFALAEADQNKWLQHLGYGLPAMDFHAPESRSQATNGGYSGELHYWQGDTRSDVGKRSARFYTRCLMEGMAAMMNELNPRLALRGKNFIAKLTTGHQSYEPVILHGFLGVFDLEPHLTVVLYAAATEAISKEDLQAALSSMIIEKL